MIRVLVLGIIRAMLVAVWLLLSVAIALCFIGAMLLRVTKVVPTPDDTASVMSRLFMILSARFDKQGVL